MATLAIRKKTLGVWEHVPSVGEPFIISQFYCKTKGDNFQIIESSGNQREVYDYADITVYDDTDASLPETFASAEALIIRLENLNYTGL